MKKDYRRIGDEKELIRKRIWDKMAEKGIARFPLPPHGRIPNFRGAERCAEYLKSLKEWKEAEIVKINPDSPQRGVRLRALKEGKTLLMPTPGIREGFLILNPESIPGSKLWESVTIKGAFRFGKKLKTADEISGIGRVDFIVEGSVAVNRHGQRLGKGEGYGDLEFGILLEIGVIDIDIPIATTVHPVQIVNENLPQNMYDVSLDYIIIPKGVLKAENRARRPEGLLVEFLERKKVEEISILREIIIESSKEK